MNKRRKTVRKNRFDFLVVNILCQQMAFLLAYFFNGGAGIPYQNLEYLNLAVIFILIDLCVTLTCEPVDEMLKRGYYKEFAAVFRHVVIVEGMVFVYLFEVQESLLYSRTFIYGMVPLYIGLTYVGRISWKGQVKRIGSWGPEKSLLIVASRERIGECIQNICHTDYALYSSVKAVVVDQDYTGQRIGGIPVVANRENLLDYIQREWVDEVFIAAGIEEKYSKELVDQLRRIRIVIHITITEAGSIQENAQQIERLGNYMVLTTGVNRATPMQLGIKRMMDIAGGIVGCVITALLFLVFALPIYISSPGPIFFTQERVGRNGKKFRLYKFRTMVPNAEQQKMELMAQNHADSRGRMFKIDNDPRIIGLKKLPDGTVKKGIGSFLRETSLDEFPQMFNILRGEMSLVGTRPPTVDEWEQYGFHHRARLSFKPGLTGLWQVSGRSKITDFEEVVKLDMKYIDEWSLGLDIKILLKTLVVVLRKSGAL